jgi:hypothetical protein
VSIQHIEIAIGQMKRRTARQFFRYSQKRGAQMLRLFVTGVVLGVFFGGAAYGQQSIICGPTMFNGGAHCSVIPATQTCPAGTMQEGGTTNVYASPLSACTDAECEGGSYTEVCTNHADNCAPCAQLKHRRKKQ